MKGRSLKIGLDLDNTINENANTVALFSLLTNALKGKAEIHIITSRGQSEESRQETILELDKLGIYYDELAITSDKHNYIINNGINTFIDDTDEFFVNLPESITVLKIREPGNFDFSKRKWVYGDRTGVNIDDKRK